MNGRERPTNASCGPWLAHARFQVRRARWRWFARRSLAIIAWLAAALGLVSALGATAVAGGWLNMRASTGWQMLGLAFLLGVIVAFGIVWRNLPSERTTTRLLDDAYGLRSQFVTACELAETPPADVVGTIMYKALLSRLRAGVQVRADRVVPIRFRRLHAVALTVAATTVLAANMVETWGFPERDAAGQRGTLGADEDVLDEADRMALAQELDALAGVLATEAEASRDAYTQALAERARELSSGLQDAGADASAAAAQESVGQLLSHLEDALGSRFSAGAVRGANAEAERLQSDASIENDANVPFASLEIPSPPGSASDSLDDVRTVRDRLETEQSRRLDDAYGASELAARGRSDEQIQEAGLIGEAPEGAEGAPAGAAKRSTDAPGDAAGGGSQELGAGELAELGTFELGEDVALPQASVSDGGRVQASAEPDTDGEATVIARNATPGDDGVATPSEATAELDRVDTVRRDSGAWRRESLDPHARLLAHRLFAPESTETHE